MSGGPTPASADAATLAWAAETLGAPIDTCEILPGGSATSVWRLTCAAAPGGAAVLKQSRGDASAEDAALITREHRILDALRPFDFPSPDPLACDPQGRHCGAPALLMSALPGRLLAGSDALRAAIPVMAESLACMQQRCGTLVAGRRYRSWHDPAARPPSWSSRDGLWERALRVGARFPLPTANSFVHRDPHPANLLFEGSGESLRVSGILDWPHAGRGPAGIDASRMAVNLACLLDLDAALAFRACFERARDLRQDPLLDVLAVLEFPPDPDGGASWSALGVTPTRDTARNRLEMFLEDAMRRMTTRRVT